MPAGTPAGGQKVGQQRRQRDRQPARRAKAPRLNLASPIALPLVEDDIVWSEDSYGKSC
jgi:hypothetical protein